MNRFIQCIDHGVTADPEDCPLCPLCDQPLWAGERITLQTVNAGPGNADLLRLVHTDCAEMEDEDEEEDEQA